MVNFFFFFGRGRLSRAKREKTSSTRKKIKKMICTVDDLTNVSLLLLRLSDSQ